MCLATAYIENNGQKEEVMRDVAWIEFEGEAVGLRTLLGERKQFQARIKSIDLLNSSIVLEGKKEVEDEASG